MTHNAYRLLSLAATAVAASFLSLSACAPGSAGPDSESLVGGPETDGANQNGITGSIAVGSTLIATGNVNLRSGPSTSDSIYHVVPAGSTVVVVASDPQNGFYNVKHQGTVGWSYGAYYKLGGPPPPSGTGGAGGGGGASSSSSSGTPAPTCTVNGVSGTCIDVSVCAGMPGYVSTPGYCPGPASEECCTPTGSSSSSSGGTGGAGGAGGGTPSLRDEAIARAEAAMGFSYWWGHGRFLPQGPSSSNAGSCSGSCPSCSHSGQYGGDCSGLAAKVWEVPSTNNDLTVDEHPYSTADFVSDTSQWSTVDRGSVIRADAMVYHSGGAGHIFIYESGDGWGSMMVYECKGCSYGCVHDLRTASSAYHAIRRAGY
jgi:hypothetical protein